MKLKLIILIGLFLFSHTGTASEISFLKSEQFNQLSKEDKVRYLNGLQKILVGMSKLSPYLADADLQSDGRKPANRDEFAALDLAPPDSAAEDRTVQAAVAGAPAPAPTPSAASTTPGAAPVVAPTDTASATPVRAAVQPQSGPAPAVVQHRRTPPAASRKDIRLDTSDSQFRCMHSGFVIEKDPCRGHQKIPDWMGIDGMAEGNKSCGPGFSVCNPVIFGLKLPRGCDFFLQEGCSLKAKPFCAQGSLWPTEECHKMATDNGNRGTLVAAEIKSEIKPQLFERFEQQFKSLCNPENIKKNPHAEMKNGKKRSDKSAQAVRDDISKTCSWADKQTTLLNEAFADIARGGDVYPHRKGPKGSK